LLKQLFSYLHIDTCFLLDRLARAAGRAAGARRQAAGSQGTVLSVLINADNLTSWLEQLTEQQDLNSKLLVPKVLNTVLFALIHDE
jgi:hypothetical protein